MCARPRLHPPLHSGVEHGAHMLLGIAPSGLLEVSDCSDEFETKRIYFSFSKVGSAQLVVVVLRAGVPSGVCLSQAPFPIAPWGRAR